MFRCLPKTRSLRVVMMTTTTTITTTATTSSRTAWKGAVAAASTNNSNSSSSSSSSRPFHGTSVAWQTEKRPLQESQLQGGSSSTTTTTGTAAATAVAKPTTTSGGDGSGALVVGGGAAVVMAAAAASYYYYYYDNTTTTTTTTTRKELDPTATFTQTDASVVTTKDDTTGHRVTQIQVDKNMKNNSNPQAAVAATDTTFQYHHHHHHPVRGHRVLMTPPQTNSMMEKDDDDDEPTTTEQALAALKTSVSQAAAEALLASHPTMLLSTSTALLTETAVTKDDSLEQLSPAQLQGRIVQLAMELKDRTKWEALRLKEFLAMKEQEVANEYTKLMQKQRLEFEDLLAQRLREQEHVLRSQLEAALREKDANIQSLLDAALEAQKKELQDEKEMFVQVTKAELQQSLEDTYAAKMQELKQSTAADLKEKVETLQALGEKVSQLQEALSHTEKHKQGSAAAHRLSAAALNLSERLSTHQPAGPEIQALRAVAGQGSVIATAVATIPQAVHTEGVATLAELQTWFDDIFEKVRQAALVPAGRPGLEGQLAGRLLASLKFAPQPKDDDDDGDGDKGSDDKTKHKDPEVVLAKARRCVQKGDLTAALGLLDSLPPGQTTLTVSDWKTAAVNRILVDKAVKVIKMECALLNESLVD
mmetsp:Transcript_17540/g.32909  ORF Transcript_17540/g.32909 Transcript_17540/m.32909 type:complete len:648 (+) Transcript_17540:137-2080(+)